MKKISGKVFAVLSAISLTLTATACGSSTTNNNTATTTKVTTEKVTEADVVNETDAVSVEATTEAEKHESPLVSVTSDIGYQIKVGEKLDHDSNKTYKASLKDFGIEDGDNIKSITFVVSSDTTMDSYQGAWGISVDKNCSVATDDSWYEADDFTENLNSKYAEITVDVPTDVASSVDVNGQIMLGFWWSSAQSVTLEYIIINETRTKDLPVDG